MKMYNSKFRYPYILEVQTPDRGIQTAKFDMLNDCIQAIQTMMFNDWSWQITHRGVVVGQGHGQKINLLDVDGI